MSEPPLIPPARTPARDVDLRERRYIGLRSSDTVGITIAGPSGPVDPVGGSVDVVVRDDSTGEILSQGRATRADVGQYGWALDPSTDTAEVRLVSVEFSYTVDTPEGLRPLTTSLYLNVSEPTPAYDALNDGMKAVVDSVWVRFADLFDSPQGGPHLQTYIQSHFGRNRMAQLLEHAIGRLNIISQPFQTYTLHGPFPFAQWSSLLSQALYVETIKHLIRSYTEIPETILATSISRNDRRDYTSRWSAVLDMETADLKDMLEGFKMANMGLGSASVMVSGGAFGNMGPVMQPGGLGHAAARGYYTVRGGYV